MQSLRTPLIIIIFFFACLFLLPKVFGPIPFTVNSIQTTKSNFFSALGTGEEKSVPDTVMVSLGVTKSASTADEAKKQMNAVTNKVVANLKNLGIEDKDIKTTNFSVSRDTSYPPPLPAIEGALIQPLEFPQSYIATQNIEVTVKTIDLANKAIDLATKDGANAIGTPNFTINENKRKELTKLARKKAITDAKKNAQELADAAGIRLGKVVDIREDYPYQAYGEMSKNGSVDGVSQDTQLNPGENTVRVNVTLSYETL